MNGYVDGIAWSAAVDPAFSFPVYRVIATRGGRLADDVFVGWVFRNDSGWGPVADPPLPREVREQASRFGTADDACGFLVRIARSRGKV